MEESMLSLPPVLAGEGLPLFFCVFDAMYSCMVWHVGPNNVS